MQQPPPFSYFTCVSTFKNLFSDTGMFKGKLLAAVTWKKHSQLESQPHFLSSHQIYTL